MPVVERTEEGQVAAVEAQTEEPQEPSQPAAEPEPAPQSLPTRQAGPNWAEIEAHPEFGQRYVSAAELQRQVESRSEAIIQRTLARERGDNQRLLNDRIEQLRQQMDAERTEREWDQLDEDGQRDRAFQMVQSQRVRQRLSQELEPEIRRRVFPEATQQAFQATATAWLRRPEFQAEPLSPTDMQELASAASAGTTDWYNKWAEFSQRRVMKGYVPAADVERIATERAEARFRELQQRTALDNEPEAARPTGSNTGMSADRYLAMTAEERDSWEERATLGDKQALERDFQRRQ